MRAIKCEAKYTRLTGNIEVLARGAECAVAEAIGPTPISRLILRPRLREN